MKNLCFISILLFSLLFASCEKSDVLDDNLSSLKNTEWVGEVGGISQTLIFVSESILHLSALSEKYEATYSWNSSTGKGYIKDTGNNIADFEVKGSFLYLEVDEYTRISFKRSK